MRADRDPQSAAGAQGRETNTDASFRNLTRPKVLTKAGQLIDPIKMPNQQPGATTTGLGARKPAPSRPRKSAL